MHERELELEQVAGVPQSADSMWKNLVSDLLSVSTRVGRVVYGCVQGSQDKLLETLCNKLTFSVGTARKSTIQKLLGECLSR